MGTLNSYFKFCIRAYLDSLSSDTRALGIWENISFREPLMSSSGSSTSAFVTAKSYFTPASGRPSLERRIQSRTRERSRSQEPASEPSRFKGRLDPGASPTRGPNQRARRNRSSSMKYEFWRKLPRMMHCRYSVFQVQQSLAGSASTCGFDKFLTARLFATGN